MKLTIQEHMNRFKAKHGDGDITMRADGRMQVPVWLLEMVLHLSGIKTRKRRIVKKTITRKINELLERASDDT
jgi:hypothetical protein